MPEPSVTEPTTMEQPAEPSSLVMAPPAVPPPTLLSPEAQRSATQSMLPEPSFDIAATTLGALPPEPASGAPAGMLAGPPPEPDPEPEPQAPAAALDSAASPMPDRVMQPDNTDLPPVVWGKPSFLIRPVTGAPGNGNEALTEAIKRALRDKDMTITEDPRQAGYLVVGKVDVGAPVNGRQQARIVWQVTTITGDEVGKAIQENAVTAGSLDGRWGRVAKIVSVAAVNGIQELFDQTEGRSLNPGEPPYFPDVPNLEQVPGRAPPPPG